MIQASPWSEHADSTTILRGVVGSTAHGLALEGTDDRDEMAVCLPSPQWTLGLSAPTHLVQRTAAEGERSKPGDLDLTIYTLRRYIHLLVRKANPTCQILLWLPGSMITVVTSFGEQLRSLREGTICQSLGRSFLGYMRHQLERLKGERGQMRVKRPELVAAHGYDTKYAGHVLRLGYQGIEMASDGRLTLPMAEPHRTALLSVRRGDVPLADVLTLAHALTKRLERLIPSMPPHPHPFIEEWMVGAYLQAWNDDQEV